MRSTIALLLTLCVLPVPALAQEDPIRQLILGETNAPASDALQDPTELARTRELNDEIVRRNDEAEATDRANQAAYEDAQARYRSEVAEAERARTQYESDLRTAEASRAQHEREMADWRAKVEACRRHDRARCEAGSTPARSSVP